MYRSRYYIECLGILWNAVKWSAKYETIKQFTHCLEIGVDHFYMEKENCVPDFLQAQQEEGAKCYS